MKWIILFQGDQAKHWFVLRIKWFDGEMIEEYHALPIAKVAWLATLMNVNHLLHQEDDFLD